MSYRLVYSFGNLTFSPVFHSSVSWSFVFNFSGDLLFAYLERPTICYYFNIAFDGRINRDNYGRLC